VTRNGRGAVPAIGTELAPIELAEGCDQSVTRNKQTSKLRQSQKSTTWTTYGTLPEPKSGCLSRHFRRFSTLVPFVLANLKNELAPELAQLAQSMGFGGFREAIDLHLRSAYDPA